jgi:hypothetical protein
VNPEVHEIDEHHGNRFIFLAVLHLAHSGSASRR